DMCRRIETSTSIAQAIIKRLITSRRGTRQIKFVLHGCLHNDTQLRRPGHHALQEGAWASLPRLALQGEHITEHHGTVRNVGEHDKGAGIGYQAKLPNGPQALDGCQGIHAREGLHGERLANALAQALRQAVDVRGFATDDAAVVTVHEADQAYVRFCRTLENSMCVHWTSFGIRV